MRWLLSLVGCGLLAACGASNSNTELKGARTNADGKRDDGARCEYKGMQHVYYLSRVTPEGLATYVSSDSMAGTISLDGKAKAVGGSVSGTCLDKTLAELRASGQAHDLKR